MTTEMTTIGNAGWVEFSGPDAPAAQKFYAEVMGWNIAAMNDMPYQAINLEDGPIGGFSPQPAPTGAWIIYITVADVDAATATAKKLGATIDMEPIDAPGVGRTSRITDPQGAKIALITYESMME